MKFYVRDDDGTEYDVEEIDEGIVESPDEESPEEIHDDALLPDEIAALKRLAGVADKLLALIGDETHDADEEEEFVEEEEPGLSEEEEEIIDTDRRHSRDSKHSFGTIETRRTTTDPAEKHMLEVEESWAKRYNNGGEK